MMAPKEEAIRLVNMYLDEVISVTDIQYPLELPKRLALVAIRFAKRNSLNTAGYNKYLDEVQQEIKKL